MTTSPTRDAGLQAERTALAWRRTALSAAAVAALSLHQAAERGWAAAAIPALFAVCAMLMLVHIGCTRSRRLQQGYTSANWRAHVAISMGVVCCAAAAGVAEVMYAQTV